MGVNPSSVAGRKGYLFKFPLECEPPGGGGGGTGEARNCYALSARLVVSLNFLNCVSALFEQNWQGKTEDSYIYLFRPEEVQ